MSIYFALQLLVIIIAIISTFIYRRRRLKQRTLQPPAGFQKTNEIFIDPTTGVQQQVWFNPSTGERFYERTDNNKK
ncbi:hypothetical protein AB4Z50_00130 [Paenibacillus sp. 2TAB26]|uniref:hypothetical protein n=1 Tax=Paenibacillus sp. 2TAB26 TaxID=3233005 RepID=UPI003F993275